VNNKLRRGSRTSTRQRPHPALAGVQAGPWNEKDERLPGIYALLFVLSRETAVTVGRLGRHDFPAGCYVYVGSGMAGVGTRIRHHLRPHPRPRWHLDYLLPLGKPAAVIAGHTSERLECPLAISLGRQFEVFRRFGSSDCRCRGHLFHNEELPPLANAVVDAIQRLGCEPLVLPISLRLDPGRAPGAPALVTSPTPDSMARQGGSTM
jgi:Uri superfamily endonuclease